MRGNVHINRWWKNVLAIGLVWFAQSALAEEITLPVPGEAWSMKFEAPAMTAIEVPNAAAGHVYTGNAGKLNLSLHVETPDCTGGDSAENLYKCFSMKVQRNPYIVAGSISVDHAPGGVQILYIMEVPVAGRKVRAFNLNYLFARDGKWGDLHISVVSFTGSDLETVKTLMSTLQFVETKLRGGE